MHDPTQWDTKIKDVVHALNITNHAVTKLPPSVLFAVCMNERREDITEALCPSWLLDRYITKHCNWDSLRNYCCHFVKVAYSHPLISQQLIEENADKMKARSAARHAKKKDPEELVAGNEYFLRIDGDVNKLRCPLKPKHADHAGQCSHLEQSRHPS